MAFFKNDDSAGEGANAVSYTHLSAKKILEATGINPDTRVKDLTDEDEAKIRECI